MSNIGKQLRTVGLAATLTFGTSTIANAKINGPIDETRNRISSTIEQSYDKKTWTKTEGGVEYECSLKFIEGKKITICTRK